MAEINYDNGDKYSGEELNGSRNGFGRYTFVDGSFYEGEYVKDRMEGWGTYSFLNGDIYVGEWKNDKEDGQGTFTWGPKSDFAGDKYEGAFKNGVKSGYGTYYWSNGDMFEGYWENDQQNGQGTYTYNDGEVTSGEWKNGVQISVSDSPKEINTKSKERVNNNNTEKTIVIKQEILGYVYGEFLETKNFIVSSFDDLQNQLKNHFVSLLESGFLNSILDEANSDKKVTIHAETDQEISTCLYAYKNLTDAENDKYRLWFVKEGGFFPPDQLYFSADDEQWENVSEQFADSAYDAWGLDKLISNPPKKLTEALNDKYLKALFEIYKKAAHDENWEKEEQIKESESPKTLTAETKKVENITTNVDKASGFRWEKIYNTEEMIALQAREQVFHYIFQYYNVEDVDDLTKKQINEIIKFRDQDLSEFSNLKSGFNDLIGMWES